MCGRACRKLIGRAPTPPDLNDNIGGALSQSSQASADEYEDRYSPASESSVSSDDEKSQAEVDTIVERALNMIRPSRLGRIQRLTSRMSNYLQIEM
jgi:hypothetical protein